MPHRPIRWVGSALADLRAFPDTARRRAGQELDLLQQGLEPTDFKPMPSVGAGVYELRIRAAGAFRVFYVAKFAEGCTYCMRSRRRHNARNDSMWNWARNDIGKFCDSGWTAKDDTHGDQNHAW